MTNKIKSWVPDVWTTVPWLTTPRIDGAAQAQHLEAKPQGAALDVALPRCSAADEADDCQESDRSY